MVGGRWGRGVGFGVKVVDLCEEVIEALALGTSDALFNELDDRRGFIDKLNVAGAYDQTAAGGEKTDDGVVALMTENVAHFAAGARRLCVGIRDFEKCHLACIDAGPAGVILLDLYRYSRL